MLDPYAVTRFDRNDVELEEFLLFAICVAGKRAVQTAAKVHQFLSNLTLYAPGGDTPLGLVRACAHDGALLNELRQAKIGQYTRAVKAITELATRVKFERTLNLRTCTPGDLETIPGIGPKTARFFVLHTREAVEIAVLDTHILRWLREIGHDRVPRSTPTTKKQYARWERVFLKEAEARGTSPGVMDLAIWSHYSTKQSGIPFHLA